MEDAVPEHLEAGAGGVEAEDGDDPARQGKGPLGKLERRGEQQAGEAHLSSSRGTWRPGMLTVVASLVGMCRSLAMVLVVPEAGKAWLLALSVCMPGAHWVSSGTTWPCTGELRPSLRASIEAATAGWYLPRGRGREWSR